MDDDRLITAVKELTSVVRHLEETLGEYPKRAEVEKRFTTKREAVIRIRQTTTLMAIFGFVALLFSFATSTGTVSYCFLSPESREGNAPQVCNIIPGFESTQKEQGKFRRKFERMLEQPAVNDMRLDRIEKELGIQP